VELNKKMSLAWQLICLGLLATSRCCSFIAQPYSPSTLLKSSNDCRNFRFDKYQHRQADTDTSIDLGDLMEMDVVIFSEKGITSSKHKLGAVQEDGRITPLCVWTMEPAFGNSLEFLVDEEDLFPGYQMNQIHVHSIVPQNLLSYGSRQIGGGMGPGNPHGEESELLYYIDRSLLNDIEVPVKPELEIFW
jgi:hypothetical protein